MCQGKRERKAAEKKAKAKRKEEARRRKKRPARNPELKIKQFHKSIFQFLAQIRQIFKFQQKFCFEAAKLYVFKFLFDKV